MVPTQRREDVGSSACLASGAKIGPRGPQPDERRAWRSLRRLLPLLAVACAAFWAASGCSSSSAKGGTQTPLISVLLVQYPPTSMTAGTGTQVSATVANDVADAGVDWVATCGSAPNCGSF